MGVGGVGEGGGVASVSLKCALSGRTRLGPSGEISGRRDIKGEVALKCKKGFG